MWYPRKTVNAVNIPIDKMLHVNRQRPRPPCLRGSREKTEASSTAVSVPSCAFIVSFGYLSETGVGCSGNQRRLSYRIRLHISRSITQKGKYVIGFGRPTSRRGAGLSSGFLSRLRTGRSRHPRADGQSRCPEPRNPDRGGRCSFCNHSPTGASSHRRNGLVFSGPRCS